MAQTFHPSANGIARIMLFGLIALVAASGYLVYQTSKSPYVTRAFEARQQPIQFSHEHHVGGNGHRLPLLPHVGRDVGVRGHSADQDLHELPLADLVEQRRTSSRCATSFRNDESIEWVRVHDLPDFVYFNHSIHVNKGVGCATCHGRVDQMPLMWTRKSLQMEWCLDCHRDPEKYRPAAGGGVQDGLRAAGRPARARRASWSKEYQVKRLTSCSTCHR